MEFEAGSVLIKGDVSCKLDKIANMIVCEVKSKNTFYEAAKYWLIEAGAKVDENNIYEVCQAMDDAGKQRAEEIAQGY